MNGLPMLRANALAEVSAGGQGDPLWTAYWPMSAHSIWFDSFLVAIMLVAGLTLALLSAWTRIGKRPRAALGLPAVALEVGAPADLVVLDRDPHALDWSTERPSVRLTVHDGRVTHRA